MYDTEAGALEEDEEFTSEREDKSTSGQNSKKMSIIQ